MIHTKFIFLKIFIFAGLALHVSGAFPVSGYSNTKGIKTSYKRYSLFKYKNEAILCEPYIVKKDDWLYKVFQKKGELSKKNFPSFLSIFNEINPHVSNIDAIKPGTRIFIPLKKTDKEDYKQITSGNIDIPVIEFSTLPDDLNLAPFIKKHKVKKGETVSGLMHRDFSTKGCFLSKEGLIAFQLTNPSIKNIHIIYEGADIYLPDPSIKSQPWFKSLVSGKPIQNKIKIKEPHEKQLKLEAYKLVQLKKYSALIGGTLLSRGKMYFPGENNSDQVLDLSSTPIIDTKNGSKILILQDDKVNDALLKNIQAHWKEIKTQLLSETIDSLRNADENKSLKKTSTIWEYKKIIETLLLQINYEYIPDSRIPFVLNNINLEASFGRVIRKNAADLLINFGNVYGSALKVLEKREFEIILITPKLNTLEMIRNLFLHLGYATWENPSFATGKHIENINGLYAAKEKDKLFIPIKPLSIDAIAFLKKEGIKILTLGNKTQD